MCFSVLSVMFFMIIVNYLVAFFILIFFDVCLNQINKLTLFKCYCQKNKNNDKHLMKYAVFISKWV